MSVKVAIRVRPFNSRQKFLGCISCVDMRQNTTILYQNRQKNKKQHYFTFDYSLWSHDEFHQREDGYMAPASNKYVDQQKLYNLIGREILDNAWQGYNCCLFAYGQTGAGKSYSMIGYGVNRGIIPMVCQEIFQRIKKYQRKGEREFQITLSMLEIYNQKVQDLFVPTSKRTQNGLKIRENKTLGVYVEGLTKHQVFSYMDIERRMDQGSKNRSLASTLMNQYSSRAHTIIIIEFVQKEWINKLKMNKKSSFLNLVDLAGSQRVAKTGIIDNKDRLKEASNINKSLHTLGRVIEILAEQSAGKKNTQVPYRDSALTRILQTALGGNSKTIMICAISPANDNYQQTLSTLRYADQTKKIKNKPIINESAVDKIIRELREENQRLKRMLETSQESNLSNSRGPAMTETEKKEMRSNVRASMRQVQKQIKKNLKSFAINTEEIEQQQSLMMTEFIDLEEQPSQFFSQLSFDLGNKAQVYITNLNEDQLLNHKVRYSCEKDILITNKNNKKTPKGMDNYAKIVLCGLGIEQNHAKIVRNKDRYFIEALSQTSSEYTLLNGKPVYQTKQLEHNDRIILGINSIFIFKNNLRKKEQKEIKIDYEFAVNQRQLQMQNLSLISPTSLNLFLSNNLLRNTNSKEIYANPPTQAYNQTKKLLQQQNQKEILAKIADIQSQFSKLVKQNEEKLRQKEDFYRGKLNQLRKQKDKEKLQKSSLQEKLMIKSIQSETLKTKNSELQKLKQKLSKYNQEKNRRKKYRQSFLLANDQQNPVIEEDVAEEFIEVEDPRLRKAHEIGIGPDAPRQKKKEAKLKKNNRNSYQYEEIAIEQFDNNEDIINHSIIGKQNNESMLLLDEDPYESTKNKDKKRKQQQALEQVRLLKQKNLLLKKELQEKRIFQFRRLYNIKVKCQIGVDHICKQCLKTNSISQNSHNDSNIFITKYLPNTVQDAQLEEYTFKGQQKKKTISYEEMLILQQQIIQLQSKLLAKQQALQLQKLENQELLLNTTMERQSSGAYRNRMSFATRKSSDNYGDFQLNLTQEIQVCQPKPELKLAITEFIQVLADIPRLSISKQGSLVIKPTPPAKPQLNLIKSLNYSFVPLVRQSKLSIDIPSSLSFQFEYKKPDKLLQYFKSEQFHYSSNTSLQRNQKTYKMEHKEEQRPNEQILLDDSEILQDEVYQQQIIVKKKTQTKAKQSTKQVEPIKQQIDACINTDEIEQQPTKEQPPKEYCQFGINTHDQTEQQVIEKEKMNSFTAFLTEQLEQTAQNTQMELNQQEIIVPCKQFAEMGVNSDQIIQKVKETQSQQVQADVSKIQRDVQVQIITHQMQIQAQVQNTQGYTQSFVQINEAQIQVNATTVQADMVTDINMESYEQFRNNNDQQVEQANQDNEEQNQRQGQEEINEKDVNQLRNANQVQEDQQQLLQTYLEGQGQGNTQQQADPQDEEEVEDYLQKVEFVDHSVNTSIINKIQSTEVGVNSTPLQTKESNTNTHPIIQIEKVQLGVNTSIHQDQVQFGINASIHQEQAQLGVNTSIHKEQVQLGINTSIQKEQPRQQDNQQQIDRYLEQKQEQQQLNNYLQTHQAQNHKDTVELQLQRMSKMAEMIIQNKIKSLNLISHSLEHIIYQDKPIKEEEIPKEIEPASPLQINASPIQHFFNETSPSNQSIKEFKIQKFDIVNENINVMIESKISSTPNLEQQHEEIVQNKQKVEMVDEQVQISFNQPHPNPRKYSNKSDEPREINEDSNKSSSNEFELVKRRQRSNTNFDAKLKELSNSQELVDKFNLSFSQIEKHELSYQQSVMGFDGLLKQEQLNHKIKLLQNKIKQLQSQQQVLPLPTIAQTKQQPSQIQQNKPEIIQNEEVIQQVQIDNMDFNSSIIAITNQYEKDKNKNKDKDKFIPIKKTRKNRKKKNQMTQEEKREQEIQKEIQAKIIQCNNQNIINERSLQVHKRKRQAEQLRKILLRKEKVQLQKQLLVLIPMIKRFNMIARQMKRLIEAKISIQYRNFSHYEMIEILKSYSANKKNGTNNIQIRIVVLNCEEGRIYTWPSQVFKNRFEIAQQIFQKYLQSNEDLSILGRDQRNEKAKDPFWDPIDFIPQGIGYLSMQVLLYNLSYQGYISLIYKSTAIAKIYVSISPVKLKKHNQKEQSMQQQQSQLDHVEIFNIRSLLEKDLFFTISIQSITFLKSEEKTKLDDSGNNINLNSLNSNILKYNISYELLERDYKQVTFTTHNVDFVEDKQFKRIDYLRRHTFQNISESTLAYISDCPIRFTLNVMKDYNEEVINASFNNQQYSQDNDQSELDKSMSIDGKSSMKSGKTGIKDQNNSITQKVELGKSDFSKKPSIIFENTELINKLQTQAKKQQQKRDKIRKLEQSKAKHGKGQKGDKQCVIY